MTAMADLINGPRGTDLPEMRRLGPAHALLTTASLVLAGCGALPGSGSMLSGLGGNQAGGVTGRGGSAGGGASGVGGWPPGMECGEFPIVIPEPLRSDVLFVVDASAAMNDDVAGEACSGGCGASSKWALAAAAVERLAATWDAVANLGLEIFPEPDSVCGTRRGVVVPVGPGHAAAIVAALGARTSANGGVVGGGNAPVRGAIDGAAATLATLTDQGPKNVLLVTAGAPNCLPGGSDTGVDDSAGAVQAVSDAAAAGIRTTVLGVATPGGTTDMTLDALAVAAGTARAGPPSYTPVGDVGELMTTRDTLLRINPPCVFSVPAPPTTDGTTSRSDIGVKLDGTLVPPDPNRLDGWDYVDASHTAIQLYGPSCQALAVPPHTVSIVFHCGLE